MCVSSRNVTALTISATLCLALISTQAWGYCLMKVSGATKPYVAWKTMPVEYRISSNLKDAKIRAAIAKAFTTWGSQKCSKLKFKAAADFTICADAACKTFTSPTVNYISVYWFTTTSSLFANTSNPKVPYMSYVYFSHDNAGGFAGVSIGVNGSFYKWGTTGAAGVLDVENEMATLIGGAIGLDDSKVVGATMYNKITFGDTTKRTLHQDDLDGLIYLYKDKGCPSPPSPGANGCSSGSTTTPDGPVTPPKDGAVTPPKDGPATPPKDGTVTPPADQGVGADKTTTGADGLTGNEGGTTYPEAGSADDTGGSSGCTRQADCASDEVCTIEGKCVKQGGGSAEDDGGCSCEVSGRPGQALPLIMLIGLVLLARRRRSDP